MWGDKAVDTMLPGNWEIVDQRPVRETGDFLADHCDEFITAERENQGSAPERWYGIYTQRDSWKTIVKLSHENLYPWKGYDLTMRDGEMVLLSDMEVVALKDLDLPEVEVLSLAQDWLKALGYIHNNLVRKQFPVITASSLCVSTGDKPRGILRVWAYTTIPYCRIPVTSYEIWNPISRLVEASEVIGMPIGSSAPEDASEGPAEIRAPPLVHRAAPEERSTRIVVDQEMTHARAIAQLVIDYFQSRDYPHANKICETLGGLKTSRMSWNTVLNEFQNLASWCGVAPSAEHVIDRDFLSFCRHDALKIAGNLARTVQDEGRSRGHDLKIVQNSLKREYYSVMLQCRQNDCPVHIRYNVNGKDITLSAICLQHNHARNGPILTRKEKEEIAACRVRGVTPGRIRMDMNLTVSPDALYNCARKALAELRKSNTKDIRELAENCADDWATEIREKDGRLETVVFVNKHVAATAFADDIWLFDDTSCTNTLGFPIVPIAVVDEHRSPQILAICSIQQRSEEQFRSVFEIVENLCAHGPRVGVCDRNAGQKAGFKASFPRANLVFCRRHVRKNADSILNRLAKYEFGRVISSPCSTERFEALVRQQIEANIHQKGCQKLLEDLDGYAAITLSQLRLLDIRYNNMTEGMFGNVKNLLDFQKRSLAAVFKAFILYAEMQIAAHDKKKVSILPSQLYNGPPVGQMAYGILREEYKVALGLLSAGCPDSTGTCRHRARTEYGLPCQCELLRALQQTARPLIPRDAMPARHHACQLRGSTTATLSPQQPDLIEELISEPVGTTTSTPRDHLSFSQLTARFEQVAARAKREDKVMDAVMKMFEHVEQIAGAGQGRPTSHPAHNVDRPPSQSQPGRPRAKAVYKCSICRRTGHNKATCPQNPNTRMVGAPVPPTPQPADRHEQAQSEDGGTRIDVVVRQEQAQGDNPPESARAEGDSPLESARADEQDCEGEEQADESAQPAEGEQDTGDPELLSPPWRFIGMYISVVTGVHVNEFGVMDPIDDWNIESVTDLARILIYPTANEDVVSFLGIIDRALEFPVTQEIPFQPLIVAVWLHIAAGNKNHEHSQFANRVQEKLASRIVLEHVRESFDQFDTVYLFPVFDRMYKYVTKEGFSKTPFADIIFTKYIRDVVRRYTNVEYTSIDADSIPRIMATFDFMAYDQDGLLMLALYVMTFRFFLQGRSISWSMIYAEILEHYRRRAMPGEWRERLERTNLHLAVQCFRADVEELEWPTNLGDRQIHKDIDISGCHKVARAVIDGYLINKDIYL